MNNKKRGYGKDRSDRLIIRITNCEKQIVNKLRSEHHINVSALVRDYLRKYSSWLGGNEKM